MNKKSQKYRLEIRLGLALIILVLLILNFAAHYTIYRVQITLENQLQEQLYEAAIKTANYLQRLGEADLPDSTIASFESQFFLNGLSVFHFNYDRVMMVKQGLSLDSVILQIDSSLTADILSPLLLNQSVFLHRSGSDRCLLLFPTELAGSRYIITLTRDSAILGSLENAGRILIFFGLLGMLIILYVARRFIRFVTYPFRRLKEKAEISGRLENSDEDEVRQVISTYENMINELRRNERELTTLNEMISRRAADLEIYNNYILESIDTGIITLDNDQKVSTANRAVLKILHLDDKIIGLKCQDLFDRFPNLEQLLANFIKLNEPQSNRQVEINHGLENKKLLSVYISPLFDSQDHVIGSSILLNDQSEFVRLQTELELKRQMASLGEMSGGLAHQLRNSIGAIVGFAKLSKRKIEPGTVLADNMDNLLRETDEAERLVSKFLDFARPLNPDFDDFSLLDLLDQMILTYKEKYSNIEFDLENKGDENLIIYGDSLLIKQAFGNIIDNGCQSYDNTPGLIKIKIEIVQDKLEIRIIDNGGGIPVDYHDKIFTPFFSGSPSGSGLGLPLARKIIGLHSGNLEFESEVGQGSSFMISLPLTRNSKPNRPQVEQYRVNS